MIASARLQRRWTRRRRSGSEQGLSSEVVRFLNLVSGAASAPATSQQSTDSSTLTHNSYSNVPNGAGEEHSSDHRSSAAAAATKVLTKSEHFWLHVAAPAVEQRYGAVALELGERANLFELVTTAEDGCGMATLITRLCAMTGVKLADQVHYQCNVSMHSCS